MSGRLLQAEDFKNLPPMEELPDLMQGAIAWVGEARDRAEKIHRINQFAQGYIRYVNQDTTDQFVPFRELLEHPHGDCDDLTHFSAVMLHYAGFDAKDISFVAGVAQYTKETTGTSGDPGPHAVLLVRNGEHRFYLMDSNLTETPVIMPRDHQITVTAEAFDRHKEDLGRVRMHLDRPFVIFTYDGNIQKNEPLPPEFKRPLLPSSSDITKAVRENSQSFTERPLIQGSSEDTLSAPAPVIFKPGK